MRSLYFSKPTMRGRIVQRLNSSQRQRQHIKQLMEIGAIQVSQAIQDHRDALRTTNRPGNSHPSPGPIANFPEISRAQSTKTATTKTGPKCTIFAFNGAIWKIRSLATKIEPLSNIKSLIWTPRVWSIYQATLVTLANYTNSDSSAQK